MHGTSFKNTHFVRPHSALLNKAEYYFILLLVIKYFGMFDILDLSIKL